MWKEVACFPSTLLSPELVERFNYLMAGKGNENGATTLQLASAPFEEGQVRFFSCFFMFGLVPTFSDLFSCIMNKYGLHLLQLHTNAVTTMAIFTHLCEKFIGIVPSVPLLRHYYTPKINNDSRLGSITWYFRNSTAAEYIGGHLMMWWQEWRSSWCLIKMADPPAYCAIPQGEAVHNPHRKGRGPWDEEFSLAIQRIKSLRQAGLMMEMVVADYLWRCIAPLQRRSHFAWEYNGPADNMRLWPGLKDNLTEF